MLFEELLHKQYNAGKADGIAEGRAEGKAEVVLLFLEKKGEVSDALRERILSEADMEVLERWLYTAVTVTSVAEFTDQM